MRKYLVATLIILIAAISFGCGKNKQTKHTDDRIKYVTDGEAVKDDSVFGKNTYVYSTSDDINKIQEKLDSIYQTQQTNQFGEERYAVLFKPGKYNTSLKVNVGFYTQISGLGTSPKDTNLNELWVDAKWDVYQCNMQFLEKC